MASFSLRKDMARFYKNYLVYFLPITFLVYLALESYQIDFRSFYLAGKSALLGLDPYLNYVTERPDFYGPVNAETAAFSGFRYPPLAALLFTVLAGLPYPKAKLLFTLAMVGVLGLLSFGLVRRSQFTIPGEAMLFMMVSFPVLALVERGQVDSLLVYITALAYWLSQKRQGTWFASFLLALAGVFKIFPLVMLVFYGLRRQWRFVAATLLWVAILFGLPYLYFGWTVYANFFKRTFPDYFGQITTDVPMSLHDQGLVFNKIVLSVDADPLIATHDFVNGFMNPLLSSNTIGALLAGGILTILLLIAIHRCPVDFQFYALLNVINLYNPVAWIMGLVWYLPMFLYLYPRMTRRGQFLLLLPLFLPPFLNVSAVLAYLLSIVFGLAHRLPFGHTLLTQGDLNPAQQP